jgi:hypothetical protein
MRVVYVHGAGRQENRHLLKRRLDGHLFGSNQLDRTILAYFSDILHVESDLPDDLEATTGPVGAVIERAFEQRALDVAAAQPWAHLDDDGAGEEELPDPAFLVLARIVSRDVTEYLVGGGAEAMRGPVRDAIRSAGSPAVVIAHSLGTIVTYDVLSDLGPDAPEIPLLLTLGSPLGLSNVLERLVGGTPPPPGVPVTVQRWDNIADRFDPVALVQRLSPLFDPLGTIHDSNVNNEALLSHDLTGYLDTAAVQSLVRDALGIAVPS